MRSILLIIFVFAAQLLYSQLNTPKVYEQNKTLSYHELIAEYQKLADASGKAELFTYGKTDVGLPLHLFVICGHKEFNPKVLRTDNMRIVLINNGIHPGEPAGIEASLQLAAQLLSKDDSISKILKNTVVCIIPTYNVGGMLNRSAFNRANQNGPEECGFRGNARNIDLNRDYMINHTENAQTFTEIFHKWKPDVFLETHTTDGSDHQQTITLITTAHQDLPPVLGEYLDKNMSSALYGMMDKKSKYLMCPYVHVWRKPPDEGFQQVFETPRYSTGYTSLFNTLSFMTETHIFKPFEDRVLSTVDFMHCLLDFTSKNSKKISALRNDANDYLKKQDEFVLDWTIDSSKYDMIIFHGYEATYPPSKLTGEPMLYYDREKPYTKEIKYFNHFEAGLTVDAPKYYVIPQAWKESLKRLDWNKVDVKRLTEDITLELDMYYIDDYKSYTDPYNGHYPHYDVKTSKKSMKVDFYKGDYVVPVKGRETFYIMHALEPAAPDSYFSWNLFDEILQSREYFSPFIFEERAMQILDTTPGLKEKLEAAIKLDTTLAKDTYRQMQIIYRNSPYFEKTYLRYPVGRIDKKRELPLVSEKDYQ
ncbi:MAG: M14 family zinc carboxypeptidase [Salinivirgaceae bacterium]|jgi:hypothetical protein|nr:M14 family zinc carboxypeptidase [Salinivirgaceae bacterium]